MIFRLWHFTSPRDAVQFQADGFPVGEYDSVPFRFCFSHPGERYWERLHGPALLEVWLEYDERVIAGHVFSIVSDGRTIPFYSIPSEEINGNALRMHVHETADGLPTVAEDPRCSSAF
jgi:hypothetical protein